MNHAPANDVFTRIGQSLTGPWRYALGLAAIAAITAVAYLPAMNGQLLWDDDAHITRPDLRTTGGLYRIWFDIHTTQQYYPLLFSWFWVQHRLWGDHMLGYHLVNLLLHLGAAYLVYAILRKLDIPGALLATAIFALHPVHVESVAWVTEQKNTLSAMFYLGAMLAYLNFDTTRRPATYLLALALFVAAVLSKTVTVTLPPALLVIFWWQRGTLSWKRDVVPLLPFFAVALADGLLTVWVERNVLGAQGPDFELNWLQKPLLAGRALWFYLAKFAWPADLMFIYPRWQIAPSQAWQWLFPVAALALLIVCWAVRKQTRAPLAGLLFFLIALFPVLGFLNVFFFRYSYVSDHFPYLASLGLIVPAAGCFTLALERLPPAQQWLAPVARTAIVAVLALLSWRQSDLYGHDLRHFWETTLARNPDAAMAHTNLGRLLLDRGDVAAATEHFQRVLELNPDSSEGRGNLGLALRKAGREQDGLVQLRLSVQMDPMRAKGHYDLGTALLYADQLPEAIQELQEAVRINPRMTDAHHNLALALFNAGQQREGIEQFRRVFELQPDFAGGRRNFGRALFNMGRTEEALQQFQRAVDQAPEDLESRNDLAGALLGLGRTPEAIAQLRQAVQIQPDSAAAHNRLGMALLQAGQAKEAVEHLERWVRAAPDSIEAWSNLASATLQANRPSEAIAAGQKSMELARAQGKTELAAQLEAWVNELRAGPAIPSPTLPPP